MIANEKCFGIEGPRTLKLNISGRSFGVPVKRIHRIGIGLLYKFANLPHDQRLTICDDYYPDSDEYFFARPASLAEPILTYYLTGSIHYRENLCKWEFREEMEYWQLQNTFVASCCADKVPQKVYKIAKRKKTVYVVDDFKDVCCLANIRKCLWAITEDPSSSIAAKIFMSISISFIVLSFVTMILGSIPALCIFDPDTPRHVANLISNITNATINGTNSNGNNVDDIDDTDDTEIDGKKCHKADYLYIIEFVCLAWFTLELLFRFMICPKKLTFFRDPFNVIDLIAIIPFYLDFFLQGVGNLSFAWREVLMVVRLLRVLRILRLARHSRGVRGFGRVMIRSLPQLGTTALVVLLVLLIMSTLVYYTERNTPNTPFISIPAAMWYTAVSITTVGYGDLVPATIVGKLLGSVTIFLGIFVMALPISIFVENVQKQKEEDENSGKEL